VVPEDAVDQVTELCVHAGELNGAEDGRDYEDAHEVGLLRYGPLDLADLAGQWCGFAQIALVRAQVAQ